MYLLIHLVDFIHNPFGLKRHCPIIFAVLCTLTLKATCLSSVRLHAIQMPVSAVLEVPRDSNAIKQQESSIYIHSMLSLSLKEARLGKLCARLLWTRGILSFLWCFPGKLTAFISTFSGLSDHPKHFTTQASIHTHMHANTGGERLGATCSSVGKNIHTHYLEFNLSHGHFDEWKIEPPIVWLVDDRSTPWTFLLMLVGLCSFSRCGRTATTEVQREKECLFKRPWESWMMAGLNIEITLT